MIDRFLIQNRVPRLRDTHRNPEGYLSAYENVANSLWKRNDATVLILLSGIILGYDNINTQVNVLKSVY